MHSILKLLLPLTLCLLPFQQGHAYAVKYVTFKESARKGATNFQRKSILKKTERKSNSRSQIIITFDETVPDSIQRAFTAAKDLWESTISAEMPIYLEASFGSLGDDMSMYTEVGYIVEADNFSGCPLSLYTQKTNSTENAPDDPCGFIMLNSDFKWNCSYSEETNLPGYNVMTMALRGIAICLGFGSSVIETEPDKYVFFNEYPSYFDKLLTSGSTSLANLEQQSTAMKNFVTSGKVALKTKSATYNVYSPSKYEPNSSLIFLSDANSLMSQGIGEGSIWQTIDNGTVDILRYLGWDIPSKGYSITCDDISDNGIGSAYASHKFSLNSGSANVSSIKWFFSLKGLNGQYVNVKNGSSKTFTIDKVSAPQNYQVDMDGDLNGIIECEYVVNGTTYKAKPFAVSLELKPAILSIDNIRKDYEANAFTLHCNVTYAGAEKLTVEVEEEYTTVLRAYRFEEPFTAHVTTGRISTFTYSWVTIVASNQYGSASKTLEFEPTNIMANRNDRFIGKIYQLRELEYQAADIRLYSTDGALRYTGPEQNLKSANLPRGMYIKVATAPDGSTTSTKTIIQ